jgi:fructosamine-3-kinase
MSTTESDISWHLLRQIVQDWAGNSVDLVAVSPLDGGCVNTTLHLTLTDGQQAVIKVTPHRVNLSYQDESKQLAMMRQLEIPVPQVYQCVTGTLDQPNSYLLMEFVHGIDLHKARAQLSQDDYDDLQKELADYTWRMHAVTAEQYGRMASGHQPVDDWAKLYKELYGPIVKAAAKSPRLGVKCRRRLEKVHDKLPRLIANADRPRLTHGDLWSGNVLCHPNGDGRWHVAAILDPNCTFAHAEAEIAYLELFNTANHTFMHAYQDHQKLSRDYHRIRKPVYQLYELMNHVQLFGSEYVKPLCETLDRVMG